MLIYPVLNTNMYTKCLPQSSDYRLSSLCRLKLNNPADREEALNRLYSQVEKLPPVAASPSDVLAARV